MIFFKKFISITLSINLLVFSSVFVCTYAGGEIGKEPEINYTDVANYFREKSEFGPTDEASLYNRENIAGKKREVFIFNLPKNGGKSVAREIQSICNFHVDTDFANSVRQQNAGKTAIEMILNGTAFLASAAVAVATGPISLPVVVAASSSASCGICCCCIGCCTGCTYCGITKKSKDIVKLCNKLNELIKKNKFLNSNILIIAFDKRDSPCCRKNVYVGFKYIAELDPSVAPVVTDENYFKNDSNENIKFEIEVPSDNETQKNRSYELDNVIKK